MATIMHCDYCGDLIEDGQWASFASISVFTVGGGVPSETRRLARSRDFHASSARDCLGAVLATVERVTTSARRHREEAVAAMERHEQLFRAWHDKPITEREQIVLTALGEGQMSARELKDEIEAQHDCAVYRCDLDALLRGLLKSGDLDRLQDPRTRARRNVWFRRAALSGPIVDLERAFDDSSEAA